MSLTEAQQAVLGVVTNEPRTTREIADAAGFSRRSTREYLMKLAQKGLAKRSLQDATWRRA